MCTSNHASSACPCVDVKLKKSVDRGFDNEHNKRKRVRRAEEASNMGTLALTVGALQLCYSVRCRTKIKLLKIIWSHICNLNGTPVKHDYSVDLQRL